MTGTLEKREPPRRGLHSRYMEARSASGLLVSTVGALVLLLFGYDVFHSLVIRPASEQLWEGLTAACLAWTLVCAVALAATAFELVVVRGFFLTSRRTHRGFSAIAFPIFGTVVATPVLWILAQQPFIGNRYRDSPIAAYGPAVVFVLLACLAVAGIWLASCLLARLASPDSGRFVRATIATALVALLAVLVISDTFWYAGWYPLVHSALSAASAVLTHTLLAILALTSRRIHAIAVRTTLIVLAVLAIAAPVSALRANQTVHWRVATGTLFASRVLSPILGLASAPIRLEDLDRLPNIPLGDVTHDPAVTGVPPALAENGLLVTVDTLRFDAVGPSRNGRSFTPSIDAQFVNGQVFERAYSQYASTRHSIRALLDSRYGALQEQDTDNLIARLRDYRYEVIAVLPTDLKTFVSVERYNFTRVAFYEDPSLVPSIVDELTRAAPAARRFLWVHLYQPHDPYEPLPEFRTEAGSRGGYEGEVRWVDRQFADIASRFSSDRDIVVLGSDHGEEFREHGGTLHGRTAYDETLRVPLALRVPGITPQRRQELVANVDVAPTILAALGIPVPDSFEGYDLLGRASIAPGDRVVYSETVTNAMVALRQTLKWIYWPELDLWEAYDLDADPRELHNLAADPEVMAPGRQLIARFRLLYYVLPALESVGPAEYGEWLRRRMSQPSPSAVSRWAAFQAGKRLTDNSEVRFLFEAGLKVEHEPLVRVALLEGLDSLSKYRAQTFPIRESLDTGSMIAILRRPEFALDEAVLRRGLEHPVSAVRRAAAEQSALRNPAAAVALLSHVSAMDAAVVLGTLGGLSARVNDVEHGYFRRFLDHDDVEVRMAAVRGLAAQEREAALLVLKRRGMVERSPSVARVVIEQILKLDREEGLAAVRREIKMPLLSDFVRAFLISQWNLQEEAEHLVSLFIASESGPFRNYLFTAVSRLDAPRKRVDELVRTMGSHAFEPALRSRMTTYLQR